MEDRQRLARLAEPILDETEAHVYASLVAEGSVLEQLDGLNEVLLGLCLVRVRIRVRVRARARARVRVRVRVRVGVRVRV